MFTAQVRQTTEEFENRGPEADAGNLTGVELLNCAGAIRGTGQRSKKTCGLAKAKSENADGHSKRGFLLAASHDLLATYSTLPKLPNLLARRHCR